MHCFAKLTAKLLQSSSQIIKPIYTTSLQTRPLFARLNLQSGRSYSVQSTDDIEFEVARKWYSNFNESTIPTKLAETTYSAAGGPGGQKTNKYVELLEIQRQSLLYTNPLQNIVKSKYHLVYEKA